MKDIYPDSFRTNNLSSLYCDIATEAFYYASKEYEKLPNNLQNPDTDYEIIYTIRKNLVVTTVFSAMCIESFFNDYAATCMGDSEYYDNYDKLSIISKFHLISSFILETEVDKSKKYFYYLKRLFKRRDDYVHNKSKNFEWKYTREELISDIDKDEFELDDYLDSGYKNDKADIYNKIKEALCDLKAIKEIALYFDSIDSSVCAINRLFNPFLLEHESESVLKIRKYVLKALDLKVQKL